MSSADTSRAKALEDAWATGYLAWKLRPYQATAYEMMWAWLLDTNCRTGNLNISRRWGKSTLMNLVATEVALKVPGAQIRAAAPTGMELRNITVPIMRKILADCPPHRKPKWRSKEKMFLFPNGSEYHLAGSNDGHADDLRGTACHLAMVDEAGFIDELDYLIDDVLTPQTLDTGGTLLVSSTPPRSPAHDYVGFAEECKREGHYLHRDIHSMGLEKAIIDSYAKAAGGYETSTFKREYLALFVVDTELAIVPEWDAKWGFLPERAGLYPYYHKYSALDLGVRDLTAGLHGYYDFIKAKLVVEDEWRLSGAGMTTPMIAKKVREHETRLWGENPRVYRRVSDNNNLQLVNDLNIVHSLGFFATSKDELPAMVNKVKVFVGDGRVLVAPHCKDLLGCLATGVWKSEAYIGREFGRSRAYGHFDHLAALTYWIRNLDVSTNPIPAGIGLDPQKQFILPGALDRASDTAKAVKEIFRLHRR